MVGLKNMPPVTAVEGSDPVGVAGRVADEHVVQHPFGDRGGPRVADVIRAELVLTHLAERHVVPHDLQLVAVVVLDHVQRQVRVRRLDVVVEFDVVEFGAPDDPFLLFGGQRVPRTRSCRYFCTCACATAAKSGSSSPIWVALRANAPPVLGAVDGPSGRVVEELEAVHLVDHRDGTRHRLTSRPVSSEADVSDSAMTWSRRSPGWGAGSGAVQRHERMQFGGPRSRNNRSNASSRSGGDRQVKPMARTSPGMSGSASYLFRHLVDGGDQNMAAGVNGASTGAALIRHWDPIATVPENHDQDGNMAASPQSLCEFIDSRPLRSTSASPSRSG